MIPKSIRGRIQIWHTTLLTVIVAVLLTAFYLNQGEILERELDARLAAPIANMIPQFMPPPPPEVFYGGTPPLTYDRYPMHRVSETPQERRQRFEIQVLTHLDPRLYLAVLDGEGTINYASQNAPSVIPAVDDRPFRPNEHALILRENGNNREAIHVGPRGYNLVIGGSKSIIYRELARLRWILSIVGLLIVVSGHWIGWWLAGISLRPIGDITETAQKISTGDLSHRINTADTESELGAMAEVLNETFDQLEDAINQQIRFTSDASHELRTPISVILASCQYTLLRERDSETYRDALQTCEHSAQHIRRLVDALLELARVDSGEFELIKTQADIADAVNPSVRMLKKLADEKSITLYVGAVTCTGMFDIYRIQQVLINLLSNAIKFTPEGGKISINVGTQLDNCLIMVKDSGMGIYPEIIPRLFDRFYRTSKNKRIADKTNTGLGLAITKAIVDAHGGSIQVESEVGVGTLFTVTLPRSEPASLQDLST